MILVQFVGANCPACNTQRTMSKTWAKTKGVEFLELDIMESRELAMSAQVQTLPTLAVISAKSGDVVYAEGGVHDKKQLDALWERAQALR